MSVDPAHHKLTAVSFPSIATSHSIMQSIVSGIIYRLTPSDLIKNAFKTCILSRVKQITSPGWMHETSASAWCTGKTQRDWVEKEVGRGLGWGIHVNP